jgi:hypothetical protein
VGEWGDEDGKTKTVEAKHAGDGSAVVVTAL